MRRMPATGCCADASERSGVYRTLQESVTPESLCSSFPRKREPSVYFTNATGSPLSRGRRVLVAFASATGSGRFRGNDGFATLSAIFGGGLSKSSDANMQEPYD